MVFSFIACLVNIALCSFQVWGEKLQHLPTQTKKNTPPAELLNAHDQVVGGALLTSGILSLKIHNWP